MPILPPVAKVVRFDWLMLMPGSTNAQFRKFFQYGGALSLADAQTWVAAARAAWTAQLAALTNTNTSLVLTKLTDLSSATSPQTIDGTTVAGTAALAAAPNGMAVVVQDKIARRYRGGHPRTYYPASSAADLVNGDQYTAAFLASFLTNWNAFISAILTNIPVAAAPGTEVNVSYFTGFTVVTAVGRRAKNVPNLRGAPLVDGIQSHSMNPKPASQRRRNHQSL